MSSSSSSYHPARALRCVILSASVYHACLIHALSTEREEVMGLLMGQTTVEGDAHVWHSTIIPRLDKRPDRVEISSERLVAAPEDAVRISQQTGMHTRVLGWYHSHPHITPYPSHVDLATQATYQMMDPVWVGLIFSVFSDTNPSANFRNSGNALNGNSNNTSSSGGNNNNNNNNGGTNKSVGRVALHCFQSNVSGSGQNTNISHRRVPVNIVPDEFFFTKNSVKPSSVEAYVSPSLTILSEAREMKNTIAKEIEEEIAFEKKRIQQQQQQEGAITAAMTSSSPTMFSPPSSSSAIGFIEEKFDNDLYDETCKGVIETQTFTVCQKLLRPLLSGENGKNTTIVEEKNDTFRHSGATMFDAQKKVQEEEISRNEEILKSLREEVRKLREASALHVLEQ